jgi:DNA-binding IclR family transcriptional regulator
MGKAILAFRPQEQQVAYLESVDFQPFTPNTIPNVERFRKELENIRRQGYALDNEEWAIGVCCVAAPVFDFTNYPSHAISISGPSQNFTDEKPETCDPAGQSHPIAASECLCHAALCFFYP